MDTTSNSNNNTTSTFSRQRTLPRYNFIASTELIDMGSATRLSGRVTEISRNGCYVDSLNALPVDTVLNLRIERDHGTFATRGKIIYVHERIGMGVVFLDPPKDQVEILDSWIIELPSTSAI